MEKANERGGEPMSPRESAPKHSGYGTDTIGGKGEMVAGAAVRELEAQGKEFHHMVDKPGRGMASNTSHEQHVVGHKRAHYEGRGRK